MMFLLWSLGFAVLGVAGSAWGARTVARRSLSPTPRVMWVTGVPALLLAWLIPLVSLLNAAGTVQGPSRRAFMLASGAAILGVLGSDWLINREEKDKSAPRPLAWWLIGAVALAPGWVVALLLAARFAG
jgi:hypothetical protein